MSAATVFSSASEGSQRALRLEHSCFLKACRLEPVEVTPVWLMRQAGRFMPEFREIRSRTTFLELCKNSQLACEVTVMAVEMLKVDAAIIFADILLPLEPLGVGLEFVKGEGPIIERPVASPADVDNLRQCNVEEHLGYVLESIKLTRATLPCQVPLIGFAGAPFTLASYMIEGGSSRNFEKTKQFMYREPEAWARMMKKIAVLTADYLKAQVEAGADAVQLFDSWVGCLSPHDYEQFVLPYSKEALDGVKGMVPSIHFATAASALLPQMVRAGGDVIGVDWRVGLDDAWRTIGSQRGIQGNLDPTVLLAGKEVIEGQASRILKEAGGRLGHIFNLGHGVLPPTDPDNVKYLVEFVHSQKQVQNGGK